MRVKQRTGGSGSGSNGQRLGGEPACLHHAAYWHAAGVLDVDRGPVAPAPGKAVVLAEAVRSEPG
jgi:hypothetical protein